MGMMEIVVANRRSFFQPPEREFAILVSKLLEPYLEGFHAYRNWNDSSSI